MSPSCLLLLSTEFSASSLERGLTHRLLLDQGGWRESPGARWGQAFEFLKGFAAKGKMILNSD